MKNLNMDARFISRSGKLSRAVVEAIEPRLLLTGTISTLANLDATSGSNPTSEVVFDSSGNLIGTATNGGAQNDGTLFAVNPATKAATALASFDGSNGSAPRGGVIIEPSGNLLGLAGTGGSAGYGTVFEYNSATPSLSAPATLVNVNGSSPVLDGAFPDDGLTFVGDGSYFGTTAQGGANGEGTVFQFSAPGTLTPVVQFNGNNGSNPQAPLVVDADGNLYGTTSAGGDENLGAVFEISSSTHDIATLASFTGDNGGNPLSGLIVDSSGDLFGCTSGGGINSEGTVFEVVAGSNAITTLATFDGATTGGDPLGSLIMDSLGNLFGTTSNGGANGDGTVFEVTAGTDTLKTVATFDGTDGANPQAGLIVDANNNLYGTTNAGGTNNLGTVFELTGSGFGMAAPTPVFTVQPAGAAAGQIISPAITVSEEDANSQVAAGTTGSITVSLINDAGATLSGTLNEPLINGVATFSDLSVDMAGSYMLSATDGGTDTISSQPFTIAPPPPASLLMASLVKSTLPAAVVAGAKAHAMVIARVTNTAGTASTGTSTVAIYASSDGTVDGSSILLGSVSRVLKLGAGVSKPLNFKIKSFPANLNGSYTLFAKVTDSGGDVSVSAAGASLTAALPFVTLTPTIVHSNIPASLVSGGTTHDGVQLKISNSGNIASAGKSTITLLFSPDQTIALGTQIRSVSIPLAIKAGANKTVKFKLSSFPVLTAGQYSLVAELIDPNQHITQAVTPVMFTVTGG